MALFHLHLLLTVCFFDCVHVVVCMCMSSCEATEWLSLHIVELQGSSSYTLIMALRWRIPEASSLIDSSVPFLPRPR